MALAAPYSGSTIGVVNAQNFIPEMWASFIRRQRDSQFVMANMTKTLVGVGRRNDIFHIPLIGRLAVNDKISDTQVKFQARTENEYTIKADKYKECSFALEDVAAIQINYALISEYTREAGYALSRDWDNFLLGLRAGIVTNGQHDDTGASMAEADFASVAEQFKRDRVPGPWYCLIAPEQESAIRQINRFTSRDFVDGASRIAAKDWIGNLYGFYVMCNEQVTRNSTDGYQNGDDAPLQPTPGVANSPYLPTQDAFGTTLPVLAGATGKYSAVFFSPEYACTAVPQNQKTQSGYMLQYLAQGVVNTQLYGAKLYREKEAFVVTTTE